MVYMLYDEDAHIPPAQNLQQHTRLIMRLRNHTFYIYLVKTSFMNYLLPSMETTLKSWIDTLQLTSKAIVEMYG
jgi:hypothetical protein